MPGEVKNGNHAHADSKIYMPYKELLNPWDLQFKVYLYGQQESQNSSYEKSE